MYRFRWVDCQLDSLRKCITLSTIRQTLNQLPLTLDDTYKRILQSIPDDYRKEANCVLNLLVVSFRPLKLDEVAEAVAVDCDNKIFDPENRLPDHHDILEICSSLVTWSGYRAPFNF